MNEVLVYPKVNTLQNQREVVKTTRLSSVWCYSWDSSLCVCVCVCVWACMRVCAPVYLHICIRVCWYQGYHSSPSCLSLALNFPSRLGWLVSESGHQPLRTSLVIGFCACTTTSCFLHFYSGFGGLNLGSPACMVSTLPTEQSPQPPRFNMALTSFSLWPAFPDPENPGSHIKFGDFDFLFKVQYFRAYACLLSLQKGNWLRLWKWGVVWNFQKLVKFHRTTAERRVQCHACECLPEDWCELVATCMPSLYLCHT